MEALMVGLGLVLSLLACYFSAISGIRGRGSKKLWIGLAFVGLFVCVAFMSIGHQLVGAFDPVLFYRSQGESHVRQMAVNLLAMMVRISMAFCVGSFLAVLFYRKRHATSPSLLGLGEGKQ